MCSQIPPRRQLGQQTWGEFALLCQARELSPQGQPVRQLSQQEKASLADAVQEGLVRAGETLVSAGAP